MLSQQSKNLFCDVTDGEILVGQRPCPHLAPPIFYFSFRKSSDMALSKLLVSATLCAFILCSLSGNISAMSSGPPQLACAVMQPNHVGTSPTATGSSPTMLLGVGGTYVQGNDLTCESIFSVTEGKTLYLKIMAPSIELATVINLSTYLAS